MLSLGNMGEHEAIRRLTGQLDRHDDLRVGVGDDCAVAQLHGVGMDQVYTSDAVIEHVHFKPNEKPVRIGNKAVGRVLSDIAAMGAQPQWILVNVVAPQELDFQVLEDVYSGMTALCNQFNATIIGGDLAQGACLELHVFGTGLVPEGKALLRSGARARDTICVSGSLGCSSQGKHLDFTPRVTEGIFLRESGLVHSLMDLSDGLATDLRHVMEQSKVGAVLNESQIPANGTLEQALYDGEDYELLFTVPPEKIQDVCELWRKQYGRNLAMIGNITSDIGVLELTVEDGSSRPIGHKGFEHFSASF